MERPDDHLYCPKYEPWRADGEFQDAFKEALPRSLVDRPRMWVLWQMARHTSHLKGEMWECGVFKGGTARLIGKAVPWKAFRLFDSFQGFPELDPERDSDQIAGRFAGEDPDEVAEFVGSGRVQMHAGFIPETFKGLEDKAVAFAHIDVDLYKSVMDCCKFIWPRMLVGGVMIFDDYAFPDCRGARDAVDEFFKESLAVPLCMMTGQAMVVKSTSFRII